MTQTTVQDTRLTVAEFLAWDGEPGRHYELIDGEIVMMAPATRAHNILVFSLGRLLGNAIPPESNLVVEGQSGIAPPWRDDTWYEADVIVAGTPEAPSATSMVEDVVLIAEVLSVTTSAKDRLKKLPDYRRLPTVRDILLIEQTAAVVQHHWRRDESEAWTVETIRGLEGTISIASFPATIPLKTLYAGILLA